MPFHFSTLLLTAYTNRLINEATFPKPTFCRTFFRVLLIGVAKDVWLNFQKLQIQIHSNLTKYLGKTYQQYQILEKRTKHVQRDELAVPLLLQHRILFPPYPA